MPTTLTHSSKWTSEDNASLVRSLKLNEFDVIVCRICNTTHPLSGRDWLSDTLVCPTCGHIEGDDIE